MFKNTQKSNSQNRSCQPFRLYRPMEIGIRLLSLLLSFLPAQLYKHAVYTVSFGRQTAPDAGEDGNLNDIGLDLRHYKDDSN